MLGLGRGPERRTGFRVPPPPPAFVQVAPLPNGRFVLNGTTQTLPLGSWRIAVTVRIGWRSAEAAVIVNVRKAEGPVANIEVPLVPLPNGIEGAGGARHPQPHCALV